MQTKKIEIKKSGLLASRMPVHLFPVGSNSHTIRSATRDNNGTMSGQPKNQQSKVQFHYSAFYECRDRDAKIQTSGPALKERRFDNLVAMT